MPTPAPGVSAHLTIDGCAAAIDFYKKAFGAEEMFRMPGPDGKSVMHAELKIGTSVLMLGSENPQWGSRSPNTLGGTPVSLMLYVADCDKSFQRAVGAGAKATIPPADMFWGDRYSMVTDPEGHSWSIATHVKDVTPEEMAAGMKAQCGGGH